MTKEKSLWNPSREHAFRAVGGSSSYSDTFCGTEILPYLRSGDTGQFTETVREILEDFSVPYLQRVLGRDVGNRIYTQKPINVQEGQRFVACMMRKAILPPNLRIDPEYRKCSSLVENIYTKNGFVRYAHSKGLAHLMPRTELYAAGEVPAELPFEGRNWIKWSREKKGIKSVIKLESSDSNWRAKLIDFLSKDDEEWQIQEHFEGIMRSPHARIHQDPQTVEKLINPISVVVDDHHRGSHFLPEDHPSSEFPVPFYQALLEDGFFGFVNVDVLCNESTGEMKINEINFRWGGSQFPSLLMKELGGMQGSYWREAPVSPELTVTEVFERMDEAGVIGYLLGNLAHPTAKTVGILAIGSDSEERLEVAKSRLLCQ